MNMQGDATRASNIAKLRSWTQSEQIRLLLSSKSQWDLFNPEEDVADFHHFFRTTIEESTRAEVKIKTQGEIKTGVLKTILKQKQCYKCGNPFSPNHFKSCLARDKFCTKCVKRGHFAKICRSDEVNFLQSNADDESRKENESQHHENEENDPVAFAEFMSRNGWEELQRDNYFMLSISDAFDFKQTVNSSDEDLNGHVVKLKTKSDEILAIADSGSPMSFLNETTARRLHQNDKTTIF